MGFASPNLNFGATELGKVATTLHKQSDGASISVKRAPSRVLDIDDTRIFDPQGTEKRYMMAYTIQEPDGTYSYTCDKMHIRFSDDGKTVWMKNLVPGYNDYDKTGKEAWVEGTVEGNEIIVKLPQLIWMGDFEGEDAALYFDAVNRTDDGLVHLSEYRFNISEEGYFYNYIEDSLAFSGACDEQGNFWAFTWDYTLRPIEAEPTVLPEGLEVKQAVLSYYDYYDMDNKKFASIARDGDDIYIQGLAPDAPEDWIKGVVRDGKAVFPAMPLLVSNPYSYYTLCSATLTRYDDWGNPLFQPFEEMTFEIGEDGETLTLSPAVEETYLLEMYYDLLGWTTAQNKVVLSPYSGDHPATPAAPQWISWGTGGYDDNDMPTWTSFTINIPTSDTEGNFINPDKISYRVYVDGTPYTFTPGYYLIDEPMTDIPYYFNNDFDIVSHTGNFVSLKEVYFYRELVDMEGLESRVWFQTLYTVDGETGYSDIINEYGTVGLQTVGKDSGIVEEALYDLTGCKIPGTPGHGIYIKTTVYDDGTRVSRKVIL